MEVYAVMPNDVGIPAAQYVRMSTDDQQYSIDNQKAAIEDYAVKFGFRIGSTYSDSGKSGVSIRNRSGLRALLQDVMNGRAKFKAILVYDVSRWGRFQDSDEAAHYEFICREAGIPVRYCAEQFENDGSAPSSVMKALKRTMAGEYSRELSVKVYQGQRRLVLLGFRMGTPPDYGLRRMLISASGVRKQRLERRERKNIKSDRTIIVPGPKREVQCVRRIFELGAKRRNSPSRIAAMLNEEGFHYTDRQPWKEERVLRILKNPLFVGCSIWGKTKRYLGGSSVSVPPERWARVPGAFTPIVDQATFDRAQRAIKARRTNPKKSDEYLLERLRRVLVREGKLTQKILKGRHHFDHRNYCKRFGSVLRAYEMVGYKPPEFTLRSVAGFLKMRRLRAELLGRLKELFPDSLSLIRLPGQYQREIADLGGGLKLAIHMGRPVRGTTRGARWVVRAHREERGLPALICTVDSRFRLLEYFVVPEFGKGIKKCKVFGRDDPWLQAGKRLESLDQFRETAIKVASLWQTQDDTFVVDDVSVSTRNSTIKIGGREIILPPLCAGIFRLLVLSKNQPLTTKVLSHPIPGRQTGFLRVHINVLRQKLGRFGSRIQTVPGAGYVYRFSK